MEGNDLLVEMHYNGALRQARWRISPSGEVRLDYEYAFDGTLTCSASSSTLAESQMRGIRWLGRGPYRVWQNRMQGTRLDVWEKRLQRHDARRELGLPRVQGLLPRLEVGRFDTTRRPDHCHQRSRTIHTSASTSRRTDVKGCSTSRKRASPSLT